MAKVIVDKGLRDTIKSLRVQNGIQAKDLAIELDKSRPYISKLENGGVLSIDSQDLIKCLRFISKETETDEILDKVFKTVSIKFSKEEIDQMLWLYNFDTVYRRIPVPGKFANQYMELLNNAGISIERLVEEINKNPFIPKGVFSKRKMPTNEWFQFGSDTYIKMAVTLEGITSILNGEWTKTNYVTLFSIVLYYSALSEYSGIDYLNEEVTTELYKKARAILEQYNIYTLSRKIEIIEKATNIQEITDNLSLHEKENVEVIDRFNPLLHLYSYFDVVLANRLINEFTQNMEWDAPFIMEIAGLPFYKLEHCSFRLKKQLLEKIRKQLNDAIELPESEKKREEYD